MSADDSRPAPLASFLFAFVASVGLALFLIRLAGPSDLMDNDQERPAAYALDAVQNGHWLCPLDAKGEIASKPPLYTWLVALVALAMGRMSLFALYLPTALATTGVALVVLAVGRKSFGWAAGFFGGLMYLLSDFGQKHMALARTDALFAFTVVVAAMLALRAWKTGGGWVWFWLAGAAATLTKGPLGVALAGAGLLAACWEKRRGEPTPIRGSHWAGLVLFLLITGGWFALAYSHAGEPLVDKLIGRELLQHALTQRGKTALPGTEFYKPTLYFLSRFAPWSVLAFWGLWRVWANPTADAGERRVERFLFCWFFAGLMIFSLAAHQRGDLLLPIVSAGALLAGRELARLLANVRPVLLLCNATAVAIVFLGIVVWYWHGVRARDEHLVRTRGVRELAQKVSQQAGDEFPLTYADGPFALQFYLNTMRPEVSYERAAQLLRGDAAAFVVVRDLDKVKSLLGADRARLHELARWPATGEAYVSIVSNYPRLEWVRRVAACVGPFRIEMAGVKLLRTRGREFVFDRSSGGAVTLENEDDKPHQVRVGWVGGTESAEERVLPPGHSWRVEAGERVAVPMN